MQEQERRERYQRYLREILQPTSGADLSYEFILLLTLGKIEDKLARLENKRSRLVTALGIFE